jgi:environmental stress-induced protein Ves
LKVLRRAGYRAIPWKNGCGVAHRIASHPAGAGYDGLDWHVSRPEIAHDGPFSHFPGLDRQFMLVGGRGVTLRLRSAADGVALEQRIDRPLEPFAFRGEWDVECRLGDGPAQALSVMTRRGRAGARIEIVAPDAARAIGKAPGEALIVYVARGPVEAWGTWGKATLSADDSILVDEGGATEIAAAPLDGGPARLVLIRLHGAPE